METYCKDEQEREKSLNLITHVDVEPAHNSDAHALMPAIDSVDKRNLKPEELTADSLYGSDDNYEQAKEHGVELVAPTMGSPEEDKINISDFQISEKGKIISCPQGHASAKVKKRKRYSVGFEAQHCRNCPHLESCLVKKGKKFF